MRALIETPQELFAQCNKDARERRKDDYEFYLDFIAGLLTFPKRLFDSESSADSASRITVSVHGRTHIEDASRHRELVRLLKEYRAPRQRWLLLAIWLREEDICEPIHFLPSQIYREFTREQRDKLRISISSLWQWRCVEAWRPYFERLLKDLRAGFDVKKIGYDERAVQEAGGKRRSAVVAACAWLEGRDKLPDAATLRNAHSRISTLLRKSQNR